MITEFESWVKNVVDHPAADPQWYYQEDFKELEPSIFLDYATQLFKTSAVQFAPYSDGQVDQAVNLLINNGTSDQIFAMRDESIPLEKRMAFLESIFDLNRDCFELRCTPHLSHCDHVSVGTPSHVSPLNNICYMFWDIFPLHGGPEEKAIDPLMRACLGVMEKSLTLKNMAVHEGALHGLGHFHLYYPQESERIVDSFLRDNSELLPKLREYALSARVGGIL